MGNATSLRHHLETAEKTGVIQLSKSNLRDIPKDLVQISHLLRTLDLRLNRLPAINGNIGLFKNLKILNLSSNKVSQISGAIGQLSRLETLNLENNQLSCLPNEIENLTSLKTLNLSVNKFTLFPVQTVKLKKLEMLDLSSNAIENIPDEIDQSSVSEMNLNDNKIRAVNEHLSRCQNLKILRLDNNQLELTSLSKTFLADSKICLLSVENNQFTLKQLQERDGYDEYSERFTSTKRKLI